MIGIYAITHRDTGRAYIGSSTDIDLRFTQHISALNAGKHFNKHLQNAWNCYGRADFVFSVLETLDSEDGLTEREQFHLDSRLAIYNIGRSVDHPYRNGKLLAETSAKISAGIKGRKLSAETRAKMSANAKLRTYSEETRAKMSESAKVRLRTPVKDETRGKLSAIKKAAWHLRRGGPMTHQIPHTEEAKAKMAAAQKARWAKREVRTASEETRAKMRIAATLREQRKREAREAASA